MNMPFLLNALLLATIGPPCGPEFGNVSQYAPSEAHEKQKFTWPEGKKAAISLTFDDARVSQLENGIPILNQHGVRATFYISPGPFLKRIDRWKEVARQGHEIGNHSMSHPCSGNFAWSKKRALELLTLNGIAEDIESANTVIGEAIGNPPRSFAYPCGQSFVGKGRTRQSYVPLVAERFATGRSWLSEASNDPLFCDLAHLMGQELDGLSFPDARALVEDALEKGNWVILAGHEIADGGRQTVLTSTLEKICSFALDEENGLWIDTVGKIGSYVAEQRE